MTEKRLNRILAIVFLIVGVLASVNTFRLHYYIRETLPRDAQQEQCQRDTLDVLRFLVNVRISRDQPLFDRDETTTVIVDKLVAGQQPTPQEIADWRKAVNADNAIRRQATIDIERHPIPECGL